MLQVQLDGFHRVFGQCERVGHDDGEHLADVADAVLHDHRLPVGLHARQRLQAQRNRRHGLAGSARDLGGGDHGMNAGHRTRGGGIDAAQAGMRDRAAQHRGMQHAGQHHVVGVAAQAAQQAQVFHPLHRAPDVRAGGGSLGGFRQDVGQACVHRPAPWPVVASLAGPP